MPTYGRGRFPALFANYINGIALQGMRNNAMRPKEAWNAPYIRGELRSNGHGKVPPKFMKSCHGRPLTPGPLPQAGEGVGMSRYATFTLK